MDCRPARACHGAFFMHPLSLLSSSIPEISRLLGYVFRDPTLVIQAFTHCSFLNECKEFDIEHNERLELLGDSVLNLLVTEFLFRTYPLLTEGDLSHMRAQLVNSTCCLYFIRKLKVDGFLLLSKGEQRQESKGRESILADLFEALLGAIYLDGGFAAVQCFFFAHFQKDLEMMTKESVANPKAKLQDHLQKTCQMIPIYEVVSAVGPDHHKDFVVRVLLNTQEIGRGSGASKKKAQYEAALDALRQLKLL